MSSIGLNPRQQTILGLAVVAAVVLISLACAGMASATVLCKNNASTTACSETYGAGTEIKASLVSGTKSKLTTEFKTIECSKSSVVGKVENAGGSSATVSGSISTLTFEECNCTVTVLKKGSLELHQISGTDNGTATSNAAEVTVSCSTIFGTVHCIYTTENTDLGTLTGGNPAKLSVNAVIPRLATSALCSGEAKWTAEYEVTSPKPLYVAGAGGEGGGATATTLTTSLSGEAKSGEEITILEGSKAKDTATLSGTNAGKATGTVKYKVYADKECKELVTSAGEVTVSEGKVPASEEKELEAGRIYYWQAEYSGDSNNLKSTSACGKEVLTVKAKTSLTTSLSGEEKSGEEITILEGSKAKDTATLSGTKSSSATGTVKYKVYADKECKELVTSAGEVTVSEGKVPASEEKELEAGRIYYWQASYEGDSLHEKSTSACGKEVLTVKASTSLSTSLSGEAKSGEEITVSEGSKVKDTASLSGTKSSTATGKVRFRVYKDKECKELASEAGEGSLSEGKASSEEKTLEAARVYYWQAEYPGDSLHQASTSACGKEVLTVKAKTSLATSLLGEGVEGEEIAVAAGSAAGDTATLSGTKASTATGTITFYIYAGSECKELVAEAGEWSVGEEGIPSSEEVELSEGTYYWQAEYSGDSLHGSAISPCTEILKVQAGTSIATSLAGEGKEGSELEVVEGASVTDTATLSGKNTSGATGAVKYSVFSDGECTELVKKAGEVSVSGKAVPSSSAVSLEVGIYYWQAEYSGDAANHAVKGMCGSEIEEVVPPVTTALSGEGSTASNISVLEGAGASDEATLHGVHASEATGTVKYKVYADSKCEELVEAAGEVSVAGAKAPPSSEVELPAGTYYWQAEYSGDELNPPASSVCGDELLDVVTPTALTTQLNGEAKEEIEVSEGASVADYGTVSGSHSTTAEGTVLYNVYADSECKELAAQAGEAEVSEGAAGPSSEVDLSAGTYYWQAEYLGDYLNQRSTSACGSEIEQVNAPITTELSAGELSGNELEVQEGTAVADAATLHGVNAAKATGTVKYRVYSDSQCKTLATEAGEVAVKGEKVPSSKEVKLEPGVYFWRAEYSGDENNPSATSSCGSEEVLVAAVESKYAALGDSFSSGEGIVGTYYARTNQPVGAPFQHNNICHRSDKAWPALVAEAMYNAGVLAEPTVIEQQPASFIFRACSGAAIANVWSLPASGQWDEPAGPIKWFRTPAQAMWLMLPGGALSPLMPIEVPNKKIKLVTLTIGGNDAGFGPIAMACTSWIVARVQPCQNAINTQGAAGIAAVSAQLPGLLARIHELAPKARIRQPFYPQEVDTAAANIPTGNGLFIDNAQRLNGMTAAGMIEAFTRRLNRTIEAAVKAARENGVPVRVVPQTEAALSAHRLGDMEPWVNPVLAEPNRRGSYHPNLCGHKALARRVMKALKVPAGKWPALC